MYASSIFCKPQLDSVQQFLAAAIQLCALLPSLRCCCFVFVYDTRYSSSIQTCSATHTIITLTEYNINNGPKFTSQMKIIHTTVFLSLHGIRRHIVYCLLFRVSVCLSVCQSRPQRNWPTLAPGISQEFWEWDEIWQLDRGGPPCCTSSPRYVNFKWHKGRQNTEESTEIFVTLFLYTIWQSVMKFGMIRGICA